ncbi:WD40 repeat-like protein [Pleurotus eryngii]|uniref:WD40 repeat-like protein n=1 Tax=Pleurotus eryngii TaxID=5323 RepID=A0A9P5ZHQ6_PLEER|nr:WD40 repeat-like protein [Pleurotus eryngii]
MRRRPSTQSPPDKGRWIHHLWDGASRCNRKDRPLDPFSGRNHRTLASQSSAMFQPEFVLLPTWLALDEEQSMYDWHGGRSVLCVAFAGDGDIILSASYAQMMIWHRSAKQGRTVTFDSRTIPSAVDAVAVSPTGSQFATGRRGLRAKGIPSGGGTVQIWDVATQSVVRTLQGHTATIQSLAFSPNETKLASGSWYGQIQVWDLTTTTDEFILINAHNFDWVCSLAFSPDGSYLLSGSADMTARIWDARNGKFLRVLSGHTDELNSVAFSADSTLVVSGSDDRTARLWKTDAGEVIQTLRGHSDWIHCVAISPDQRRIASGSDDGTVRLWDASSGEALDVYDLRDRLWPIALSPDSKSFISGTYHGKVHITTTLYCSGLYMCCTSLCKTRYPKVSSLVWSPMKGINGGAKCCLLDQY